jgi:outer membrane protein TolC
LEQQIMLNQLLYESGKVYWDWFMAFSQMKVYEEAFQLAEERYLAVKKGAEFGDLPSIDTLEAGIQVQNRKLSLQQAQLDYLNASEMLSLYLWVDGVIPVETAENTVPISVDSLSEFTVNTGLIDQMDTFIMNHPELQQYRYKIDQMEIDKRWKKEQLKPVVNLKYNALSEPVNGNPFTSYNINNYTWGFEFSMPLFLRKERGEYKLADIKIQETELDATTKKAGIEFKANVALNEWNTTHEQIALYSQTVKDYFGLLTGERKMFEAGESSLFMVNSRETGYIQAQLKLIELMTKNQKAELATSYALGLLAQ